MKKVLALLLIAVMCCGVFAACSSPAAETPSEPTTTEETPATTEDADAASLVSDAFINPTADWTQYNDLITQIKTETDYAKRTELMHKAEDILMSNYCILPFYYYNDLYMQKDYVDGIYANLFQTKFFMYATMSNGSDTLRLNLASEPDFLDPALNSTVDGACLAANSFSGLYTYNAEGHTVPACATGYTVSDDGLTYTVTLREGLKWSDGSDVTAEDFVYAWRRLVSPETDSPEAEILSMVAGYEDAHAGDPEALGVYAEDEHTFVVTLSTMCPYFVDAVCTAAATMPVQQKAVEGGEGWSASRTWFVGNGPYRRTGDWSDSLFATLVKQEDHYNARQVRADRIEIRFKSAAEAAKDAGTADAVIGAAGEDGTYGGSSTVGVLLINQMATNMDRTELRQAMSLVIDRDAAAGALGADYAAAEGLVPHGIRTAGGEEFRAVNGAVIDCEADTYTDRCSQALELMTQAGLRRLEALISLGTVTLLYRNTPAQTALAQRLQKVWQEKLGLSVTLQGEDAETYQQLLSSGAFTLALTELDALYNDASAYLDLWRSGDTRNYALIYMNAYNILMRVAAASTSAEARDAYLKDAEWLLLDTANVIPLYEKEQAYALRGDVTGVVSDGMGAWYFGALWRVEQ